MTKDNLTVWKFNLPNYHTEIHISMPSGARILSVGNQRGQLVLWALVDPNAGTSMRKFMVCETGRGTHILTFADLASSPKMWYDHEGRFGEFSYLSRYIGTVQIEHSGGSLYVLHVFEVL